jgi:hypothetical protein
VTEGYLKVINWFVDTLSITIGSWSLLESCLQTCMTYTIAECTVNNSWWWTEELSEICRVSFQNKFEKLVSLVGFIIKQLVTVSHNFYSSVKTMPFYNYTKYSVPFTTFIIECDCILSDSFIVLEAPRYVLLHVKPFSCAWCYNTSVFENCECVGDLTQYIAAKWWNPDAMLYVPVPGDTIFCGHATNCR